MRQWLVLFPLVLGCEARFLDHRLPAEAMFPIPADGFGESTDLAGTSPGDAEKLLAQGMFVGRAGHAGSGDAHLHRSQGVLEVRFAANFSVSGVPGPAVFLTSRDSMGGSIDAQADVNLGTLRSISGAQSYRLPPGADVGRRNVFVFCQPFRVEVAKAALVDLP